MNESFTFILILILIIAVIVIFVKASLIIRNRGGSFLTTMHGSTYEFLGKDKREAVEHVVEVKAKKKMDEELSGEDSIF